MIVHEREESVRLTYYDIGESFDEWELTLEPQEF